LLAFLVCYGLKVLHELREVAALELAKNRLATLLQSHIAFAPDAAER
jgi:hypothetical protein